MTWLGDALGDEVDDPKRATCAVLYVADDEWIALPLLLPADIMHIEDRQNFSAVNDEERLTRRWPPILSSDQLTRKKR